MRLQSGIKTAILPYQVLKISSKELSIVKLLNAVELDVIFLIKTTFAALLNVKWYEIKSNQYS
jgi:hypothetical protein